MTKEIKKLKSCEQKLKDKLGIFQHQLSLLETDKKSDQHRLKWLSKMISEIQDVCDKTNTLLYGMIKNGK